MIACVFLLLTAGCVATNPNGEAESEPQLDQERMEDAAQDESEIEETQTEEVVQNVPETGTEQTAEEEKNLEYYLEMANDDISFIPVYLEVYGEVNLVTLTIASHPVPYLFITDDKGNILVYYHAMSGFLFWDVFVEDLDQDGRQDIWAVYGDPDYPDFSAVFYQTEEGFYATEGVRGREGEEEMEEYYGDYRITQFCPAEGYEEISESVLTHEEAKQMLGKEIRIRGGEEKDLFFTYDSERRMGLLEGRKQPSEESMVTEYDRATGFVWYSASPETLIHEAYPDERMREAVGEEYYAKINGVFYNEFSVQWQHFYTLEVEDKLIMHSRLTGQYFILEKD